MGAIADMLLGLMTGVRNQLLRTARDEEGQGLTEYGPHPRLRRSGGDCSVDLAGRRYLVVPQLGGGSDLTRPTKTRLASVSWNLAKNEGVKTTHARIGD